MNSIDDLRENISELTFLPAGASYDDPDASTFAVQVKRRGADRWCISRHSLVWDGQEWVYESMPSNRTREFLAKTRFSLDDAATMARELPDLACVNGFTWAAVVARRADSEPS